MSERFRILFPLLISCLCSPALSAPPQPAPTKPASSVRLKAPSSVEALLKNHLRLLKTREHSAAEVRPRQSALVRQTRQEVLQLLATEGYFSPTVELHRDADEQWLLTVDPGEQAIVRSVDLDFKGDLAAAENEAVNLGKHSPARAQRLHQLRQQWALPVGQAFRQASWDNAKQKLLDGVTIHAYAAARITVSKAKVDPKRGEVHLQVTIDSGPPFFLGELRVIGLERLPENLVERYSQLRKGDVFDQERLLALQRVLQSTPQFASVVVDIERKPALAAAVPVQVHVSEALSRHLSFGVGFTTNTGARVEANWRNVNLRRKAWELSTGMRIEQRSQAAYADIILPPGKKYRDSFGASVEREDIQGLQSLVEALGATRSRSRGNVETALSLRYQHEALKLQNGVRQKQNALSANWSWKQRRIDNPLDPRSGYIVQLEFGGGAKALLSKQNFLRNYARIIYYRPVRQNDSLILRAEVGATLAKDRQGVPQHFLFRSGGGQSVRGYAFNSLGIREGKSTLGGRYLAVASAEYIHWFKPQWGIASFVDAGNAADNWTKLDPKAGYGLGARWRSPAGPIALDLAYGQVDRRLRWHFAIAVAF